MTVYGQTNSLYSRYGIGTLMPHNTVTQLNMGGVSVADNGSDVLNPTNAASASFLKITTLQLGAYAERFRINSNNIVDSVTGTTQFYYTNIGVPLGKTAGCYFGIRPESRLYYEAKSTVTQPDLSLIKNMYRGEGGINNAYFALAKRFKNLAFGIQGDVLFGNTFRSSLLEFGDSLNIPVTEQYVRNSYLGLRPQASILYKLKLKKTDTLNLGINYTFGSKVTANKEIIGVKYTGIPGGGGPVSWSPIDTFSFDKVTGKVVLPTILNAGFLWERGPHWRIGAEVNQANWSTFENFGVKDSTQNALTVRIGARYKPLANKIGSSYFRKLTYAAGFYTGENYLRLNNRSINTSAFTFGLDLPIKASRMQLGSVSLGFVTGSRGTLQDGLIKEGFTRFNVGASLSELWFQKSKYN